MCGRSEKVIRRGKRITKYRGNVQRYYCKGCRFRFVDTLYARTHFPDWVVDRVLDLAVKGLRPRQIVEEVLKEAKIRGQNMSISTKSISNIIKRNVKILLGFERYVRRKERAATWQIDDSPQPFSGKRKEVKQIQSKKTESKRSKPFLWITNVFEEETRYWLSAFVSATRSYEVSERATRLALLRAKYAPQLVKCDGYRGHFRGVRNVLRLVEIISKPKKEDYGWINLVERLHRTMRSLAIKKRRHFRSSESLEGSTELVRFYYNFLRPHAALDGDTPAKRAGIEYPYHDDLTWSKLIRFAYDFVKKQKRRRFY